MTILALAVVFALAIPVSSQQAQKVRQIESSRVSADQMMERIKQGMEDRFDEMDEDEDGSLSKDEFKKLNTEERSNPRSDSTTGPVIRTLSTPKTSTSDSSTSAQAQRAKLMEEDAKRERDKELEEQFDKFDVNDDGKLSKEEYLDARGKDVRERMVRRDQERGSGGERRGQRQGRATPAQRQP